MINSSPDSPSDGRLDELEHSELRFRRLFESARDGVLILDPVSRKIIEANPYMSEMLGYSRGELIGKELFEIGLLKDEAASRTAFAELQERGYIRYEHLPLESKLGVRHDVEFVSNLYPEGDQEVIQSNIRDITRRKRLEREVQEKARLLDLSNDAVIVCDLHDNIRFWNVGAETLYGWRQEDTLGQNLHSLLHSEFSRPWNDISHQLAKDHHFSGDVIQTARDGRRIPCLCRLVLDPATSSILASHTDISERKTVEVELVHSLEKAIAAVRGKDDFLAALSHELRTPLTPVLLLANEAAQDPALPEAARQTFATIGRNVALEARLIDDLLDVTRITYAKVTIDRQLVDVHLALRDAIATVQSELFKKKITLTLNLSAPRPLILGDPVRLQQVFWNVLRNAEKFTSIGGRIMVETLLLPRRRLAVKITDTGIGMTPQELERIFAFFSQGDHARPGGAQRFGGLGLGLSISRTLTELHGGTIRAESAGLGQGSTFVIELLLAPENSHMEDRRVVALAPVATASPFAHPKAGRILLVEDHDGTREALTALLSRRHYSVVAVASAAEALAKAAESVFDALLSDIGLSDGDGYALMTSLHALYRLKGIAITGYGQDEDIARARRAGFLFHLTKPIDIESLEHALAAVMRDARSLDRG